MNIERKWAMPSRWTFSIKPIKELLEQEMGDKEHEVWVDPYAGMHSPANVRNDLNPASNAEFHMDALKFLKSLSNSSADGVLYDPPYSPRQVKECYDEIGITGWNGRADFWSDVKNEIARVLRPNGKCICFGWNSMGLGRNRGFEMQRILLVPHGGMHNDTICTVEIKTAKKADKNEAE